MALADDHLGGLYQLDPLRRDAVRHEGDVGAYSNDFIFKQINTVIRELFALIAKRRPNEFLKEESLTAVDSVFTLPSDFGKLVLFRDPYGQKVYSINQDERRLNSNTGSERLYYQKGQTLVLVKAGIGGTYTLIYKSKPRDIHHGRASSGGTNSITLSSKYAPKIADYYNGMILEDVTADAVYTITDYTAARIATISGTGTSGNLYSLVPEIAEWAHVLIAPKAVIYCKLHPKTKEKPSWKVASGSIEQGWVRFLPLEDGWIGAVTAGADEGRRDIRRWPLG